MISARATKRPARAASSSRSDHSARGERDLGARALGASRAEVEAGFAAADLQRAQLGAAATQGADAGAELRDREGLAEEIVGARVEAGDALGDRRVGREEEDRRADALAAERAAEVDPRAVGQLHVEHDDVHRVVVETIAGLAHRRGRRDLVAVTAQAAQEQIADLLVIVHDQHAHAAE